MTTDAEHRLYTVTGFEVVGPRVLRVWFDDGIAQTIDFEGVLSGELYGPPAEGGLFQDVRLDPEIGTLVWPNGADFDPETLHDWPRHERELKRTAALWRATATAG